MSVDELLKNARPPQYPLVNKPIPYIFGGSSNSLAALLADGQSKQPNNAGFAGGGNTRESSGNIPAPSSKTTTTNTASCPLDHSRDHQSVGTQIYSSEDSSSANQENLSSLPLAIHPLSTPLDITPSSTGTSNRDKQTSKKRTGSQRDACDNSCNNDNNMIHSETGSLTPRNPKEQGIKRRLVNGNRNDDRNEMIDAHDTNNENYDDRNEIDYTNAGDGNNSNNNNNSNADHEETYTLLPLPSPSASPTHSVVQDLGLSPPDSFDSNQEPSDNVGSSLLVQHDRTSKSSESSKNNGRGMSLNEILFKEYKQDAGVLEQFLKNPQNNIPLINNISKSLPDGSKNILLYKLLEHSDRSVLSTLVNHIVKFLKFDILSNLPVELSIKILSHVDFKSLISVSKVCKNWAILANKNEMLWKDKLLNDNLITDSDSMERELADKNALIEKYHTIDESLYSQKNGQAVDNFTSSCFQPNVYKLIYKKYYMMDKNWNDTNFQPHKISLKAHGEHVITCLQFDADKIVTGADDKIINVFDTNTGKKLKVLEGHEGGVWGLKYIGNTLVTASTDKSLRIWNLKTGKCTHILRGHNSTVRCLDIIEPVVIGTDDHGKDIIYPKRPILVSGSRDNNLNMWDLSMVKDDELLNEMYNIKYTEEELREDLQENEHQVLDRPKELNPRSKYFLACLRGHSSSVRTLSVYGKIIVSGSYDSNVRVWNAETRTCQYVFASHTSKVYTTAIDHERNRVLSGSLDCTVNIWDLSTGSLLHTLTDHTSLVGLIQLSPKNLVTAAADATVRVWDPETGKQRYELQGHPGAITCIQHNDKRVISGSTSLLMWDINTGKLVRELLDDTTSVWQVKFNDRTCVAAVQKNNEAWIEILDFAPISA